MDDFDHPHLYGSCQTTEIGGGGLSDVAPPVREQCQDSANTAKSPLSPRKNLWFRIRRGLLFDVACFVERTCLMAS